MMIHQNVRLPITPFPGSGSLFPRLWLVLAVLISGLLPMTAHASPPSITPHVCATQPDIDGVLSDPCWANAATVSDFHVHEDVDDAMTKDTKVRLAHDRLFLYLGITCENPHMRFLDQHGISHDDPGVFKDDSIELFITREGLNRYYHYALNYANVQTERRIAVLDDRISRDLSWSYPWITATTGRDTGWTAEVAIPLEVVNAEKPGEIRLNLLRNKINVELDRMGAKTSENRAYHFWAPVQRSAHEPDAFGVLAGLRTEHRAPAPLLLEVEGLQAGELQLDGEAFSFDVTGTLLGVTPVAGRAVLDVVDVSDHGAGDTVASTTLPLPPRCQTSFTLRVPVPDFSPRQLGLRVTDPATGMVLVRALMPFEGALIQEAYPEFSFYSGEKKLRVKTVLDLSAEALMSMTLRLSTEDGKTIAEKRGPAPQSLLSGDANALRPGMNPLRVVLSRADGKVFGTKRVEVTRLKPADGRHASKVDHFRRIVLFRGKPFFPFGMYDGGWFSSAPVARDAYIRSFRKARMNTIISAVGLRLDTPLEFEGCRVMMKALREAGINVVLWNGLARAKRGLPEVRTQEEKERLIRENYEANFDPKIRQCAEFLAQQPNFLSWYGVDEPNLGDWISKLFVAKLSWEMIKEVDPYHVVLGLYARAIPRVPAATDYFDVLGYDIYTYPNWDRAHSRICDPMAAQIVQLDQRAAEKRQPIWAMPQPTALDPGRCPRPLSGQEQLCQSYTALIYGAKGLLYFTYLLANSEDTWDALEKLGRQVEVYSDALLNSPVDQTVTYQSGTYDVARWQIPPVPFRLFRFPDGRLMALAVNSEHFPMDLHARIDDLKGTRRMFGPKTIFDIDASGFHDRLEPYGVRAYQLDLSNGGEGPVTVSISTVPHPDQAEPVIGNEALLAQAKTRKNLMLNPSFERQKIAGRPDFYMPYRVVRIRALDGTPADYGLDTERPMFGEVCLRLTRPAGHGWAGVFGLAVTPKDSEKPYVYSFYARASVENTRLWVGLPKGGGGWHAADFTLSTDWERYHVACPSPGGQILMQITERSDLSRPYTVWFDGLQLEQGEVPTEFSER